MLWLTRTEPTTTAWHINAHLSAARADQLACQVGDGPITMSRKNTSANTDAEAGMTPMPTHQTKITPHPEVTASCLMEAWIHVWNTLWPKH